MIALCWICALLLHYRIKFVAAPSGPRFQGNLMKSQHVYGALAPSTCSRQASSPLATLKFHRWLSHVAWSLGFDPQIGFPIQSGQDDRLCCLDLLIGLLKTNPNC